MMIKTIKSPAPQGEEGFALLVVVGVMTVVTLFLLGSLALVLNTAPNNRRDQDSKVAIAAAEAGIQDYLGRLNINESYWRSYNSDTTNTAFTTGTKVSEDSQSSYTYQLLSDPTAVSVTGTIKLKVTGIAGPDSARSVKRTIVASLKPRGYLDYMYLSDVEVFDPDLDYNQTPVTYNGAQFYDVQQRYRYVDTGPGVREACSKYYYAGRKTPQFTVDSVKKVQILDTTTNLVRPTPVFTTGTATGFSCTNVSWVTGDVVNGPMHTNDAFNIPSNPIFTDNLVESGYKGPAEPYTNWWGSGEPWGNWPVEAPTIPLPSGNEDLKKYVEPRIDDPANPGPGCYYTGATKITFQGSTMRVLSPYTTNAPSRCLDVANRNQEQVKAIPPLIYVDATSAPCANPAVGYPLAGEWLQGTTFDTSCNRGTAFVGGNVSGQVTIASLDDIIVVKNLTRTDGGIVDMIGLIAGNSVWIYHPVNTLGINMLPPNQTVYNVEAAILTVRHGLVVQNWNQGAPLSVETDSTKLRITGCIAQKYRGPVGQTLNTSLTHGYSKQYDYDTRFRSAQPPYFLSPPSSTWALKSMVDG